MAKDYADIVEAIRRAPDTQIMGLVVFVVEEGLKRKIWRSPDALLATIDRVVARVQEQEDY